MTIYVQQNDQQQGPFTIDQANAKLASGELSLSNLAWTEGWADWQLLSSVPGIGPHSEPPPLPSAPAQSGRRYATYSDVPFYRRQWFFWIMYFTLTPIALGILLFGDIYYPKRGEILGFGIANRIVAGILAVFFLYRVFGDILH